MQWAQRAAVLRAAPICNGWQQRQPLPSSPATATQPFGGNGRRAARMIYGVKANWNKEPFYIEYIMTEITYNQAVDCMHYGLTFTKSVKLLLLYIEVNSVVVVFLLLRKSIRCELAH